LDWLTHRDGLQHGGDWLQDCGWHKAVTPILAGVKIVVLGYKADAG
jgi:hypothetical protein